MATVNITIHESWLDASDNPMSPEPSRFNRDRTKIRFQVTFNPPAELGVSFRQRWFEVEVNPDDDIIAIRDKAFAALRAAATKLVERLREEAATPSDPLEGRGDSVTLTADVPDPAADEF